jgi:hypothetical protein
MTIKKVDHRENLKKTGSILDKITEIRNHRLQFRTREEIDQYINQERNSWD